MITAIRPKHEKQGTFFFSINGAQMSQLAYFEVKVYLIINGHPLVALAPHI